MPHATFDEDIDFSDLLDEFHVPMEEGFDCIVVIDNLPIVDTQKQSKLTEVLTKMLNKHAKSPPSIYMPMINTSTQGFAFVTLESHADAKAVVEGMHAFRMDKAHVLAVNFFDEIEQYVEIDDEYVEPEIEEFVEKEHLKSWLTDEHGRDQWAQLSGDEVAIFWNNRKDEPELVENRSKWSEFFIQWSPLGSYLATFHRQGAQLWGGDTWARLVRFPHPNVKLIDFSPNEKYIVTMSMEPYEFEKGEVHHIAVWETNTGTRLRSFPFDLSTLALPNPEGDNSPFQTAKHHWPMFKWSHDDKYLARITNLGISVYETPTMGLLNKSSVKMLNVQAIEWCPSDHLLSYWTPEAGNIPAKVSLMQFPSRDIVRTKNLFNVLACKMYWQNAGTYLLVKVDLMKSKKRSVTNFELFRVKEKNVPIDVMEFKATEIVTSVAWEPLGDRFIVTCSEGPKSLCSIYQMVESNNTEKETVESIKLLKALDARNINKISFSPSGRFVVLACMGQGTLEFWDLEDMICMGTGEHYLSSELEWDPTGRYVISSVSYWNTKSDTGFIVWSFTGNQLRRENISQFKQILWRPTSKTLLTKEQQKGIRKNLKEYSKVYDEVDSAMKNRASKEVIDRRLMLWDEWMELRKKWDQEIASEQASFDIMMGKIPLDPKTMQVVGLTDVQEQTRQCLKNLEAVLKASKSSLTNVIKTTVFIKDMNDFSKINQVYAEFFSAHKPARSCVEVARLPKDVLVEIECVALQDL